MSIKIKKSTDEDHREENGELSKEKLLKETQKHAHDVEMGMNWFSKNIELRGRKHDWTRIEYIDDYWGEYKKELEYEDLKKTEWYQTHITNERHHLNAKIPEDIDLIDVLEYITDCVMATKARFGHVDKEFIEISEETLKKAFSNTIDLIDNEVEIE